MRNFKKVTEDFVCDPPSHNATDGQRNFIRKKEDFVCGNCGFGVTGDGYTDHCPQCLWGKHVDFEIPGDRESDCKGLMKPIEVQYLGGKYKILYKCSNCSHTFFVWANKNDNINKLIELTVK